MHVCWGVVGSNECPDCIKEMVVKLDALEDALKQREADIKALKDAHDDANAHAEAEEEEAQRRAAEAADAMRAREDEIKAREDEMRKVISLPVLPLSPIPSLASSLSRLFPLLLRVCWCIISVLFGGHPCCVCVCPPCK